MTDRIYQAAIRAPNNEIITMPRPARHGDLIDLIFARRQETVGSSYEQGFTTENGRFVGRREAFLIATEAGQIVSDDAHDILYTEDLW